MQFQVAAGDAQLPYGLAQTRLEGLTTPRPQVTFNPIASQLPSLNARDGTEWQETNSTCGDGLHSNPCDALNCSTGRLPGRVLASGSPAPPPPPPSSAPPPLATCLLGSVHSGTGKLLTATKSLRPPRGLADYVALARRPGTGAPVATGNGEADRSSDGPLRFMSASASRQHPIKRDAGYVYADAVACTAQLLGVCDGVSGVQQMGIQPDELPRQLLEECEKAMDRCIADEVFTDGDGHWLMSLLEEAYDETDAFGATTVLLAAFEDNQRLVVANVGDCGLLVLRPEPSAPSRLSRHFRTEELRYEANRPVQVMRLANTTAAESHLVIQGARMSTVTCKRGDLAVLGSDGLFDNLQDEEIAAIVERHCGGQSQDNSEIPRPCPGQPHQPEGVEVLAERSLPTVKQLEDAAAALVDAAILNVSPELSGRSSEELGAEAPNPKPKNRSGNADDTTAIVGVIVEAQDLVNSEGDESIQDLRFGRRIVNTDAFASASGWARGGLLGLAGIIPQCCHTTVDRGDEFEEALPGQEPSVGGCRPRKEVEQGAEPEQCVVS